MGLSRSVGLGQSFLPCPAISRLGYFFFKARGELPTRTLEKENQNRLHSVSFRMIVFMSTGTFSKSQERRNAGSRPRSRVECSRPAARVDVQAKQILEIPVKGKI
jgi:hypothetical protein